MNEKILLVKNISRFLPINPSDVQLMNEIKDGSQFLLSIKKSVL